MKLTVSEQFYSNALMLLERNRMLLESNNLLLEILNSHLTQIGEYLLYVLIILVFATMRKEWFK